MRHNVQAAAAASSPTQNVKISHQNVENKRTREVSEEELTKLRDEVSKYQVEGDLVCMHCGSSFAVCPYTTRTAPLQPACY